MKQQLNQMVECVVTTAPPNEAGNLGTVQTMADDLRIYDDTPIMQQFGFASALPPKSVTMRFCAGGRASNGVIVASAHHESRPRGLKPGQSVLHDQAGNSVLAGNDGVVTATAASGLSVAAPALRAAGNLRSATGATGTFSTPSGKMVLIRGGQVDVIAAPGAAAVTNPDALQRLLAEIRACGDCTWLNQLAQGCSKELQALVSDLTGEIGSLGDWTDLLTPPQPTPQGIVDYLQKVIKVVFGAQFSARVTGIQQLAALVQETADVPAAIADAVQHIGSCVAAFPAVAIGQIPTLPATPASLLP